MSAESVPLISFPVKRGARTRYVEDAADAHVCGASGCVRSDALMVVERRNQRRVLCPGHSKGWTA